MSEEEFVWEEQVRLECVCGHKELNEDKDENKFILMTEKYHSEERYSHGIKTHSVYACPKCGTVRIGWW